MISARNIIVVKGIVKFAIKRVTGFLSLSSYEGNLILLQPGGNKQKFLFSQGGINRCS